MSLHTVQFPVPGMKSWKFCAPKLLANLKMGNFQWVLHFQSTGIIVLLDASHSVECKLAAAKSSCSDGTNLPVKRFLSQWAKIIPLCYELQYEPFFLKYLKGCQNARGVLGPSESLSFMEGFVVL